MFKTAHQAALEGLGHLLLQAEARKTIRANAARVIARTADDLGIGGHGSGRLGLCRRCEQFREALSGQRGEHAISDAIGQHVGPLRHSRGGDADGLGGGCDRAPKQFDGACFKHDGGKVSTLTMILQACLPRAGF